VSSTNTEAAFRTCASCSLCCKLIGFAELHKPAGQWCVHCIKRGGCKIYEARPNECRSFNCGWLTNVQFGDEWQPMRSKTVIRHLPYGDASILLFHVDVGSPLLKRKEPYYSQLKQLAQNGLRNNGWINLLINGRLIVVLPGKEIDCGSWGVNDQFSFQKKWNGSDWEIDILKNGQRIAA
jgi:hypothetical protein